jgi:hypothetical protein
MKEIRIPVPLALLALVVAAAAAVAAQLPELQRYMKVRAMD